MAESITPSFADYRTVGEAAEFLGVTPATLRNWDRAGKLKPRRHPQNGYRIYLHEELEALLLSVSSPSCRNDVIAPKVDWSDMGEREHFVQFYENDEFLIDSVSDYVEAALREGNGSIVIATQDHRRAIELRLNESGVRAGEAIAQGRCLFLDALQTLDRFVVAGIPDRDRFFDVIGSQIAQLTARCRRVHAFGEMVALLWAEGNREGAIGLENLWNELGKVHSFSLFCAYPLSGFSDSNDTDHLSGVCGCHSRVVPCESYSAIDGAEERLEEITRLQQRAQALEAEISHRHAVESALSSRERELTDFFENATEGLHKVGPDGTILWANQAECDLLGYPRSEYIGQPITRFHADADVIADILVRLKRGESLKNQPARLRAKDGSIKHVLINSSACFENGVFAYTRCFTRDVTELKDAERDRALLAAIIESSHDAIIGQKLDGTITSWNQGAEQLYGYSTAEAVGNSISLLIPDDRLAEEAEIVGRIACGERIAHFETCRRRKDGSEVDVSLTVSPIRDPNGAVVGASKSARDISDRKRAELALIESNRRKDEFLATLSHELRNPLAPIRNAVETLRALGIQDEVAEECKDIIDRQVSLLTRLVSDLLDVSRISRGKIELRREAVNIASVIRNAVETSRPLIDDHQHTLTITLPKLPTFVDIDPIRIAQVISNLLNNSVKYTEPGGRIHLKVTRSNDEAIIAVSDTGVGITAEDLPFVFDMFRQVDDPSSRGQGGLGIGLTIVRQLVEMHGGGVTATSEGRGKGSEFVVRLPLCEPPGLQVADAKPEPAVLRRKILVVDDNRDSGSTLAKLLSLKGHETRMAIDGLDAIQIAEEFRPDVILMDVAMPRMNGIDATWHIRQQPWGRDVRIVALTGWGQPDDIERSTAAGCCAHLVKPIDLTALQDVLRG